MAHAMTSQITLPAAGLPNEVLQQVVAANEAWLNVAAHAGKMQSDNELITKKSQENAAEMKRLSDTCNTEQEKLRQLFVKHKMVPQELTAASNRVTASGEPIPIRGDKKK